MNKSKIPIDTKLCRECGECCKVLNFFIANEDGFADRIKFLKTDIFDVVEDGCFDNGVKRFRVTINIPCKWLIEHSKLFRCAIYDDEDRPKLCEEYPYEKSDWEKKNCLAIQKLDKDGRVE